MSKKELKKAIQEAVEAVNENYAIKSVKLFGSRVRETAKTNSDVDLIIEFDPSETVGLFAMSDIEDVFQQHLKCEADITTPDGLDEFIRDQVLAEAEVVYER